MPCQMQHRWHLCLVFYLPVLSSSHSRELVSFTAPPSGRNLHVHFLIHWGDGDQGEEHWDEGASAVGAGVGVRSGGEDRGMEQRG